MEPIASSVVVGRYLVGRRIAMGGMGEVYLAVQKTFEHIEKPLVLKLLLPHLAEEPRAVAMFLEEARLAARMNHPNVVQVFDAGEADGRYFIAMELVEGVSLAKLMRALDERGERLDVEVLCWIGRELCEGLRHAHELKGSTGEPLHLIHRDVTPHNVLLSVRGEVKLADFGIAKARDSRLTTTGAIKGKLEFLAPEQVQGAELDQRVDVYGAAMTLYCAASLDRPLYRASELEQLGAILRDPVTDLGLRRPDLPAALVSAVHRGLAKRREERFSTAAALREAIPAVPLEVRDRLGALVADLCVASVGQLQHDVTDLITRASTARDRPSNRTQVRGPRGARVLAGVALAGAMSVGAFALWRGQAPAVQAAAPDAALEAAQAPRPDASAPLTAAEPPAGPDASVAEPTPAIVRPPPRPPVKRTKLEARVGYLNVDADPWAQVFIGGKRIGDTPIAAFPVASGEVRVELRGPKGQVVRKPVTVRPGKHAYLRVDLRSK